MLSQQDSWQATSEMDNVNCIIIYNLSLKDLRLLDNLKLAFEKLAFQKIVSFKCEVKSRGSKTWTQSKLEVGIRELELPAAEFLISRIFID